MPSINELELAKELIKFPTVTPVDAGVMRFLEKTLKSLGFKTKILEFKEKNSKPVKNLYARLGTKGLNFCYAGHLDVVPPGNLKDWTVNPFKPIVKKGHLIGRGANDMKSSIAAFVTAVSNFTKNNNFNGSISLLITGDEEGVAINGTKKVVEYLKRKKEKINFCLVGEPTNPNKLGEMIKIGRRGSMTGRLKIIGTQGHVAYPHRANNPSTILVKILSTLKAIKFDKGTKDFQPTNLEITKINIENSADNVIPGEANATFNIRFNNKHSSSSIKTKLNKIFNKITKQTKSKFNIEYSVSGEAFLTKPNSTTFMIQDVIKKITKVKPQLSTTGGTSDARFIRKITPCLEFGLVGKTMHKVDEAVSVSDLKKLTLIYSQILKNYFK
ncbi:MAG: succinyl-diaminopimelate desuccinylase [Pelagibacteraceae bacterium BACL5 MAG-120705-bin12]|jgi:succinyl-diaminopimelate desuccinylase|uniref:succinyl-diaminopimelate desuccinylase n=1 Tax=Candidatus Pelagibacter sp. TaxID=2024849 RepID=UPI00071618D4|nr:MAG: succinyl-diaminopimelate desuccinylase [Pelagibacteraceae bacterium BACL5 MAG-120705-bin12]KRO61202.1 MAG: succinyl-diaminopimelate desuccinylase [Pelagibacteraceae bacterium BACL5 MAG-121128-bin54]